VNPGRSFHWRPQNLGEESSFAVKNKHEFISLKNDKINHKKTIKYIMEK
jgi:hypothetical protein